MRLHEFDEKQQLLKANEKLANYKTAAGADASAADAAGDFARGNKRFKGINRATKKQFDNDAKLARLKEQGVAEGSGDAIYPNAEVIKSKNGKPVGEIYQDGNSWGCFHYRADRGYDFIDSREEAIEALKDLHQETGRSRPDYTIKGVAESNVFTDARMNAIKADEDTFEVHGKTYQVTGDTTDERQAGVAEDQLDELSKDTLKHYVQAQPARIKGPAGLATTNNRKAARIVDPEKGDIRRALDKYKDPEYGQQKPRLPEDSLAAMRRLAGVTTPAPVVSNGPRQYRHMPTAVQPR